MSSIHFESTYDDRKLHEGIRRSNHTVGQYVNNMQKNGQYVEKTWNNMRRAATAYLSLRFAQQLGREIIQVRGEFQQLNIAFETMLGSKAKADEMMAGIIERAVKSPFTVQDIASQTKQLIAMGIAVEDVEKTVKTLGDVAAGTSVPLQRLAINYGQVSALGKLQQREIRDFAMAGVPIVEELAKQFGKTTQEIYAMVEASQIGFKDVEQAFANMAGEGGKFYNLMERQNASVTGQISNLRDKIDLMLNDIGKANEGVIYGGIEGLGNLVANYEKVINVLKLLVASYGVYKAALIATVVLQKASVAAGNIQAWFQLARGIKTAKDAQIAFNLASSANPYALAIAGITTLITLLTIFRKKTEEVYIAGNEYSKSLTEQKEKLDDLFKQIGKTEKGTNDHNKAVENANKFLKEYNVSLTDEAGNVRDLDSAYKDAVSAIDEFVAKQAKANEMMEAGKLLTSDPLIDFQSSQQRFGALGVKLGSDDIKILQNFVRDNAALINESITYSAFEGVTNYVKGGKIDELQKALNEAISGSDTLKKIGYFDSGKLYNFLSQSATQLTNYRDRINEINAFYDPLLESQKKSTEEDKEKLNTAQLIKQTQKEIAEAQEKLNKMRAPEYVSEKNTIQEDIENQETVIKSLKDKLESLTGVSKKENEKQVKNEEDRLNAIRDLAEQELELKQRLEDSKVSALKEGFEKQRVAAKAGYQKQLDDIDQQGKDYLDKLNESKGLKITDKGYITSLPTDVQENLNLQKKNAETAYNNEIVQINKRAANEIKTIWEEVNSVFKTDTQNSIDEINRKYNELIEQTGAKVGSDEFAAINKARAEETNQVVIDAKLKALDFEEEIELQRAEISTQGFNREQETERKKLEIAIKYAQLKIALLKKSGKEESKQEIQNLELFIESSEKGLNKLKKENITGYFNQAIDSIELMADKLKDTLGLTEEQHDLLKNSLSAMSGLTKLASGDVIGGTTELVTAAIELFNDAPEKLSEHYKNLKENIDKVIQSANLANKALSNLGSSNIGINIALIQNGLKQVANDAQKLNDELQGTYYGPRTGSATTVIYKNLRTEIANLNEDIDQLAKRLLAGGISDDQREAIEAVLDSYNSLVNQMNSLTIDIIGVSVDNLSTSIAEAFLNGEDAVEKWGEKVKDVIRNVIIDQIKADLLTKPIQQAVDQLINDIDNGLTPEEAKNFKDTVESVITSSKPAVDALNDTFKQLGFNFLDIQQQQQGIKGISAQLTEETGSIIAGVGTAIRIDIKRTEENTRQGADYLMQSVAIQQQIATNTSFNKQLVPIYEELQKMNRVMSERL